MTSVDVIFGTHKQPTAAWATQPARGLAAGLEDAGRRFTHLVRDRDATFTDTHNHAFIDNYTATTSAKASKPARPM